MSYSLSYALSFAAVTAIVVHTYLYNGAEIWAKLKNSRHGGEDIHKRLMNSYKEVPDWWYGILTSVVLGLGIFTVRYWDSGLPVWGFIIVCFGMGLLLIVPEGILEGTTNQRMSVLSDQVMFDSVLTKILQIPQHHHRAHCRLRVAWKADCKHDGQVLRVQLRQTWHGLRTRPETGPVHGE